MDIFKAQQIPLNAGWEPVRACDTIELFPHGYHKLHTQIYENLNISPKSVNKSTKHPLDWILSSHADVLQGANKPGLTF